MLLAALIKGDSRLGFAAARITVLQRFLDELVFEELEQPPAAEIAIANLDRWRKLEIYVLIPAP